MTNLFSLVEKRRERRFSYFRINQFTWPVTPGKVTLATSLIFPGIHKLRQRVFALEGFEYTFL